MRGQINNGDSSVLGGVPPPTVPHCRVGVSPPPPVCHSFLRQTLLDLESIFSGLGEIFRDGSLWELDNGFDGRMPEKLGRVGDMSPNGAFGRCLVYRIDVSDLLEVRAVVVGGSGVGGCWRCWRWRWWY